MIRFGVVALLTIPAAAFAGDEGASPEALAWTLLTGAAAAMAASAVIGFFAGARVRNPKAAAAIGAAAAVLVQYQVPLGHLGMTGIFYFLATPLFAIAGGIVGREAASLNMQRSNGADEPTDRRDRAAAGPVERDDERLSRLFAEVLRTEAADRQPPADPVALPTREAPAQIEEARPVPPAEPAAPLVARDEIPPTGPPSLWRLPLVLPIVVAVLVAFHTLGMASVRRAARREAPALSTITVDPLLNRVYVEVPDSGEIAYALRTDEVEQEIRRGRALRFDLYALLNPYEVVIVPRSE